MGQLPGLPASSGSGSRSAYRRTPGQYGTLRSKATQLGSPAQRPAGGWMRSEYLLFRFSALRPSPAALQAALKMIEEMQVKALWFCKQEDRGIGISQLLTRAGYGTGYEWKWYLGFPADLRNFYGGADANGLGHYTNP